MAGIRPQAARDRQGTGGTQHAPPPPAQAPKWRLALAAVRLCPGTGWGWGQAGGQTKCHQAGYGGCQPLALILS